MPWEKGEPSPGLVDFLRKYRALRRGTVCVPGCGTGHDVRAWAAAGFSATGYDLAPSAIRLAKSKTKVAGLGARFVRANFLKIRPAPKFDWIFEHTLFCAIDPSDRAAYVHAVHRCLQPAGQFLAVFYLIDETEGPPFGSTREELWMKFSRTFKLIDEWVPRSYPNRTGLELMMWWKKK
jgi:ubiquinone/menaquinone biosynthesis C-methylase UbiE